MSGPPLRGLVAFPITPLDDKGHVDIEAVKRLTQRLLDAEVPAICALGSTGSFAYFDRAERRLVAETMASVVQGKVPLVVGIGALCTKQVIEMAQDALKAGAAYGLLTPMSYIPLKDQEVYTLFEDVRTAVPELPLLIYSAPGTTNFEFSPELVVRLSKLKGVVGVKQGAKPSTPETKAAHDALRAAVPKGFYCGYSKDHNAGDALLMGGDIWASVAGGLFPKPCLALAEAAMAGDAALTLKLNAQLQPLWDFCLKYTGIRAMHAAASLLGLCGGIPSRPLLPLSGEAQGELAGILRDLKLL